MNSNYLSSVYEGLGRKLVGPEVAQFIPEALAQGARR